MTDTQLRDEVMTIFLAGHETTANALTWTFYLLSEYPSVEAKLYEELKSVLGSSNANDGKHDASSLESQNSNSRRYTEFRIHRKDR